MEYLKKLGDGEEEMQKNESIPLKPYLKYRTWNNPKLTELLPLMHTTLIKSCTVIPPINTQTCGKVDITFMGKQLNEIYVQQ